jgi:hypothetical protein
MNSSCTSSPPCKAMAYSAASFTAATSKSIALGRVWTGDPWVQCQSR